MTDSRQPRRWSDAEQDAGFADGELEQLRDLPDFSAFLQDRGPWFVGVVTFVALVISQWPHLREPPAWDAAMGVFPPAVWLHHNGFDLGALVQQPAWQDGGPNVYSLSIVTWLTALVLPLGGPGGLHLLVLHLLQFLAAAVSAATVFRLAMAALGPRAGFLLAAATVLWPVFLAQATQLYLEGPLAAATLLALWGAAQGRWRAAIGWAWLAAWIKPSALVVAAVVALAALLRREASSDRSPPRSWLPKARNLGLAALVMLGPALVVGVNMWAATKKGTNPWHFDYFAYVRDCLERLRTVPDALVMLGFSGAMSLLLLPRSLRILSTTSDPGPRAAAVCALMVLSWLGFVLAVPLSGRIQPLLPRHLVMLAGPMLIAGAWAAAQLLSPRLINAAALALCLLFVANSHGRFYPKETRSFAVAERSLAYRDFLSVQRKMVAFVAALPADIPVFYPLPDHYFFSDPLLGYADKPRPSARCVRFESPWRHGRLDDYPSEFVAVLSNAYHGGEALLKVVRQAREHSGRRVRELQRFEQDGYAVSAVEVR